MEGAVMTFTADGMTHRIRFTTTDYQTQSASFDAN
jgi:hypothetical protein